MRAELIVSCALLGGCHSVFRLDELDPLPDARDPFGPIAWYPMEPVVDMATPELVAGNDATCTVDTCPVSVDGQLGYALAFGSSGRVLHVSPVSLSALSAFTVTVWARADRVLSNEVGCLVSKRFGALLDNTWQVCLTNANVLRFYTTAGTFPGDSLDGAVMTPNAWHHVTAMYDGSNKILLLDGGLPASSMATIMYDSGEVLLGADIDANPAETFTGAVFPGAIDDVRFYDRVLSDAEIEALARRP
jgi:hypothetical protein